MNGEREMPKELTITVDDLKVVFKEWFDQYPEERASLNASDMCAEYVFDRLKAYTLEQLCSAGTNS